MSVLTPEQQDLERALDLYNSIAANFTESGLDLTAIASIRPKYSISETGAWPLQLHELPEPLAENSSRLCVLPLCHSPRHVTDIAAIVKDIRALLPPGTDVFCNPPELLHITLFHTSHPHDPRPNALDKEESAAHAKQPIPQRRAPTDAEIRAEVALMPEILGNEALTSVRIHSVQMASSGVLLMLSTDHSGTIYRIRSRFQSCIPGCPTKQTNIVHSSLMRILTLQQLETATRRAIDRKCQEWTGRLRGAQLQLPEAWYIVEDDYANIRGKTCSFSVPASEKQELVWRLNYSKPQPGDCSASAEGSRTNEFSRHFPGLGPIGPS